MDLQSVTSITLGGNSYGTAACEWISDNILKNCVNLQKINFNQQTPPRNVITKVSQSTISADVR